MTFAGKCLVGLETFSKDAPSRFSRARSRRRSPATRPRATPRHPDDLPEPRQRAQPPPHRPVAPAPLSAAARRSAQPRGPRSSDARARRARPTRAAASPCTTHGPLRRAEAARRNRERVRGSAAARRLRRTRLSARCRCECDPRHPLVDLQVRQHVSYVFISHDLAVVRYLADRIAVMYLGQIVDVGAADAVFNPPHHPYTEALASAKYALDHDQAKTRIEAPFRSAAEACRRTPISPAAAGSWTSAEPPSRPGRTTATSTRTDATSLRTNCGQRRARRWRASPERLILGPDMAADACNSSQPDQAMCTKATRLAYHCSTALMHVTPRLHHRSNPPVCTPPLARRVNPRRRQVLARLPADLDHP